MEEDRGGQGERSVWRLSVEDVLATRRMSPRGWRLAMMIHVLVSGHHGTPGEIGHSHTISLRPDRLVASSFTLTQTTFNNFM